MTVAAVILSATAEGALEPTDGQPRVRRLPVPAGSGGALPVIVLSPDPGGTVAGALAGGEAIHGLPAPAEAGPVGQMLRGAELARDEVSGTTAVLLWPARMTWVGPETVTSLIEAHGVPLETVLQPAWHGIAGWPVLVPLVQLDLLRAIPPDRMPPDVIAELLAAAPHRLIELGDPGGVPAGEGPRVAPPPYGGPPDPPAGHTHEWGEDVQDEAGLPAPDG